MSCKHVIYNFISSCYSYFLKFSETRITLGQPSFLLQLEVILFHLVLGHLYLKVRPASTTAFKVSSVISSVYPSKISIFHIFFLILSDFSVVYISLSLIKSTWQQQQLCPTSEQIVPFAYCIRGMQNWSGRKLVFTFPSTLLPGGSFPQKVGHS